MNFRTLIDNDFREILFSQVISVGGGIIAGVLIAAYTNQLLLIPAMLILIPGFLELRGNISGSLTSRISSGLFLGVINKKNLLSHIVRENVLATFVLTIILSFLLGITAAGVNYFILGVFDTKIIAIATIAGIISNFIDTPITVFTTFYLYNKGHDPNNIMGPFVTSLADIVSIIAILIALVIL